MNQPYYQGQNQAPNPFGQPILNNALGLMSNEALRQIGINYGVNYVQAQLPTLSDKLSDFLFNSTIRSYFNIDNKYVARKLVKIVFPFAKTREVDPAYTNGFDHTNDIVQEDHHEKRLLAPDLYIPLMAFMTFILMACLARGIGQKFEPDLIGYYMTNCLAFAIAEMCLYKLVLTIVQVKTLSWLDLAAFLNYKFVGLCLISLTSFGIIRWSTKLVTLYFSISFVYYTYNELRFHAQEVALVDIGTTSLKSDTILYFLSGIQFLTVWLLVFTIVG